MKITLTIEVDDNKVTVTPVTEVTKEEVKTEEPVAEINEEPKVLDNITIPENLTTIGERLPKGKNATSYQPRTEEFPFNVKDAKRILKENKVYISELAKALGNFPAAKLRNIFRYDNRRFTKAEFNVILKAVDNIVKEREINI